MSENNNEYVDPFTTNAGVAVEEGVKVEPFKEDPGSKEIADGFASAGGSKPKLLPSTMPKTMKKLREERKGGVPNVVIKEEEREPVLDKFGDGVRVSGTPKSGQS